MLYPEIHKTKVLTSELETFELDTFIPITQFEQPMWTLNFLRIPLYLDIPNVFKFRLMTNTDTMVY